MLHETRLVSRVPKVNHCPTVSFVSCKTGNYPRYELTQLTLTSLKLVPLLVPTGSYHVTVLVTYLNELNH